jgi:ribosome-binding factor A
MRRIPDLMFKWDNTFDRADRIERLISQLRGEREQPSDEP